MNVTQDKVLLDSVSAAGESGVMSMLQESEVVLSIEGSATEISLRAYGTTGDPQDEKAAWVELAILNMNDYSVSQAAGKAGIFAVPVDGVRGFKVKLEKVSGGTVTVRGRAGA